jgi:hypothetical protein
MIGEAVAYYIRSLDCASVNHCEVALVLWFLTKEISWGVRGSRGCTAAIAVEIRLDIPVPNKSTCKGLVLQLSCFYVGICRAE